MSQIIDTRALDLFIQDAAMHYDKTAPTVSAHLEYLYERFSDRPELVSLAELMGVLALREDGTWEQPNYAANRIYKLRHRLGMDTTGHAGF